MKLIEWLSNTIWKSAQYLCQFAVFSTFDCLFYLIGLAQQRHGQLDIHFQITRPVCCDLFIDHKKWIFLYVFFHYFVFMIFSIKHFYDISLSLSLGFQSKHFDAIIFLNSFQLSGLNIQIISFVFLVFAALCIEPLFSHMDFDTKRSCAESFKLNANIFIHSEYGARCRIECIHGYCRCFCWWWWVGVFGMFFPRSFILFLTFVVAVRCIKIWLWWMWSFNETKCVDTINYVWN